MANGERRVGPVCGSRSESVDSGTLCRTRSAAPGPLDSVNAAKTVEKKKADEYELKVSGNRETDGYNDFKMVLKKNGNDVAGYSFIVGRDVASGHSSYVGKARISTRMVSRKEMQVSLGTRQSNIEKGAGAAIHTGRDTHRHITYGCIRMDESDFVKLFDFLEKENQGEVDKWLWFKHVTVNAEAITSKPDPKFKVPKIGNQQ